MPNILAIDQGTTSTRSIVYDAATFTVLSMAQQPIQQHYPRDGWVEHELEEIWYSVARTAREAIRKAKCQPADITAIGITNQRETVAVWDKATGQAAHRAIVWQDRRTSDFCKSHAADQPWLTAKTGLVLDPYFSGTKLHWLLNHDADLRRRAEAGELAGGTIDAFLIHRLTQRQSLVTDVTNASRTLLYNIHTLDWDDELLQYFGVPKAMLPEVKPSVAEFGTTSGLDFLPDGVPIVGVAGDQQAALFGQGCVKPGEGKCTYGTGAFYLIHTGDRPVSSKHQLLTTIAAMTDATPQYALEGAVFIAGAAVQWLRDGLELFRNAGEVEELAKASNRAEPVMFVPGFVGLGAPHWVPEARGAMFGLTRATTAADLGRAALEGVAFQVTDLIEAANRDLGTELSQLKVDGGMVRNDWFLQCQSDLLDQSVMRSSHDESTALGAALLAGIGAGLVDRNAELSQWHKGSTEFTPTMSDLDRTARRTIWHRAVKATVAFSQSADV